MLWHAKQVELCVSVPDEMNVQKSFLKYWIQDIFPLASFAGHGTAMAIFELLDYIVNEVSIV